MPKFNIIYDEKVTTWIRNKVQIESNSKEEAIAKLARAIERYSYPDDDIDISFICSEELFETQEPMTPEENGACTVEIVDPSGKSLWNNVDKFNKSI